MNRRKEMLNIKISANITPFRVSSEPETLILFDQAVEPSVTVIKARVMAMNSKRWLNT